MGKKKKYDEIRIERIDNGFILYCHVDGLPFIEKRFFSESDQVKMLQYVNDQLNEDGR